MSKTAKERRRIPFCFFFWRWGCRIHLFRHGFYLGMDRPVYFGERYGHDRVYRIGRWALELV